jgi:tRNA threonylcarbamoyladenosine biosynthesis protein TsaE
MGPLSPLMTYLKDAEATVQWGRLLAQELKAGDVIALVGGLGAGKTHITKGLVEGLGSNDEVTSPTFTLVHEYRGGRLPVFHFDFYRVEESRELLAIGWDEMLDERGIMVVEWADRFPELLPAGTREFKVTIHAEGGRCIEEVAG